MCCAFVFLDAQLMVTRASVFRHEQLMLACAWRPVHLCFSIHSSCCALHHEQLTFNPRTALVGRCREMLRNSPTALRVLKSAMNAAEDGQAGIQVSTCEPRAMTHLVLLFSRELVVETQVITCEVGAIICLVLVETQGYR